MEKAIEVNDQIFWWIGLQKQKNSADFVWNSTNQAQALVHSWHGGDPPELKIDTESCAGFDNSGAIYAKDCKEKSDHMSLCQFGKLPSLLTLKYNTTFHSGLSCEDGVAAPPQQCWCGSVHTVCKNDSMCLGEECVVRCDIKDFGQREKCWCKDHTAVCEAGQVCEEEDGKCRDIVRCQDPQKGRKWKKMNLDGMEDYEDFIEGRNYTFTCAEKFFIEDYVR